MFLNIISRRRYFVLSVFPEKNIAVLLLQKKREKHFKYVARVGCGWKVIASDGLR